MRTAACFILFAATLAAQATGGNAKPPATAAAGEEPAFGVGFDVSSLGLGLEAAVRVTSNSNARIRFNDFNFGDTVTSDGLQYHGDLYLRSLQASYDWFFSGKFHLSPGVLIYDDNRASGSVFGPPGQQFTLGGTTYTSDKTNPISGTGLLTAGKSGPMLTVGWGNLVPRDGSHFSVNVEAGAAYQGTPSVALNLTGTACDSTDTFCAPVSSYPGLNANVQQEQSKLNSKLHAFKFYPVVSIGFGYSFGHR